MMKKIICAFSFSIFILCFLQTTTHAITIKKLDLADSFHTEKTKNTFIPGEKIYVLYTINGLKETSSGTIWMDIDVSISDVTGNIIYKNVANQSIKDKRIIKNQIIDYLVFDIPVSIIDQTVFLNITFKDERSHERITKTLEVKILEQKLSIVNIHFTSDKSNLMERPAIYLLGEEIKMYFNVTGLKLQNNNIWMKYGIEVKSVSGNILHPLKKLYNLQKNIASNESAFLTGVFKFKAGLPGNYKIIIYAYDGYTNQKVSTEVLYQIIDKDSPSFKVADLQEKAKENVSEINQDIFDKKLFPSLYKKETAEKKDTPEIRTTPDSGYKKSLLDEAGEYPDSNIKIFHEKKGLFAFKYPRDWIIEKEDEFYKKYIYVKDPLGEATIMVYLTLTHQDTREQIIEKRKQIIKECFPGLLEISSLEKITIVGKNALNCKFKGFAYSNLPALGELTIISNDQENYALYVFLAANKDNYEVFRNSYMLVIKSFKITHSIETDKEAMSNLIGTWQYSDSEKGSIEKIISFYTNGRFNQNRQNFNYSISKMPLEYVWEAYDSGSDTLDNNGKYKVVGDTLYLFYDNGSNYEFALTLGDGDFIKMNQTYYRRKM